MNERKGRHRQPDPYLESSLPGAHLNHRLGVRRAERQEARRRARESAGVANPTDRFPTGWLAAGSQSVPALDFDAVAADRRVEEVRAALSRTLRAARRRHRLSQRALAEAVGVSQATISRAESGHQALSLRLAVLLLESAGSRLCVEGDEPRLRALGEHVRDGQGRRLPAHLHHYRLDLRSGPHTWWSGYYAGDPTPPEPQWSFRYDGPSAALWPPRGGKRAASHQVDNP